MSYFCRLSTRSISYLVLYTWSSVLQCLKKINQPSCYCRWSTRSTSCPTTCSATCQEEIRSARSVFRSFKSATITRWFRKWNIRLNSNLELKLKLNWFSEILLKVGNFVIQSMRKLAGRTLLEVLPPKLRQGLYM